MAGSPAHAGIDRSITFADLPDAGFPRTRGDRPDVFASRNIQMAVPPHTRG